MMIVFLTALLLIAVGTVAFTLLLKIRALEAAQNTAPATLAVDRYKPMLRLLSEDDFTLVAANPALRKALRKRRRELFRSYLKCLTRDYGRLLAGLRQAIVVSGTDRPDLSKAIAKNRLLFAWSICKIEYRLALHATGAQNVEIANLVEAMEVLRTQVNALSAVPQAV